MSLSVQITLANPEDAERLTGIAFAAKRHWGYPERWMENWRERLTVTAEFIGSHETFLAVVEKRAVGFYALRRKDALLELVHMWVLPEWMGRGAGRALFCHAVERAKTLGFQKVEIESDPNAEGFYLRMGARRVGESVQMMEEQRRKLPMLLYEIEG